MVKLRQWRKWAASSPTALHRDKDTKDDPYTKDTKDTKDAKDVLPKLTIDQANAQAKEFNDKLNFCNYTAEHITNYF